MIGISERTIYRWMQYGGLDSNDLRLVTDLGLDKSMFQGRSRRHVSAARRIAKPMAQNLFPRFWMSGPVRR